MNNAVGELGAAIIQMLPSDDQIICEHVRRAHAIIVELWRAEKTNELCTEPAPAGGLHIQRLPTIKKMSGSIPGITEGKPLKQYMEDIAEES